MSDVFGLAAHTPSASSGAHLNDCLSDPDPALLPQPIVLGAEMLQNDLFVAHAEDDTV